MRLSVVIVGRGGPEEIEACRSAVTRQAVDQVIVVSGDAALPELRRQGLVEADGDVVAFLEARAIPARDWAQRLRAAHGDGPETIGGVLQPRPRATTFKLGAYFSDHVFAGAPASPARRVSDANVSYKRSYLERLADRFEPLLVGLHLMGKIAVLDQQALHVGGLWPQGY